MRLRQHDGATHRLAPPLQSMYVQHHGFSGEALAAVGAAWQELEELAAALAVAGRAASTTIKRATAPAETVTPTFVELALALVQPV